MKSLLTLCTVLFVFGTFAQKKEKPAPLNLRNVVIIGQMDDPADRYSVEIAMTELFSSYNVKSTASLNLMKQGADSQILASDSVQTTLAQDGFDTYVLISVRGYDKRFKTSDRKENLSESLSRGNLFSIYQEGVVSVSFEFKFFRNGEMVLDEIIKCGGAGSREKVMRTLRKKTQKRLQKSWL